MLFCARVPLGSISPFCCSDSWKPSSFSCAHLLLLFLSYYLNLSLIYIWDVFTLFWKAHQINANPYSCYILSLSWQEFFPWLIIPLQCTGLGFSLVRYFSFCLIFPIFSLFPMDAHYCIMLLECEKVLLADFAHFCIWAITVLLLFQFVPFHHLFSKVLFLRRDDDGDLRLIFLSLYTFCMYVI